MHALPLPPTTRLRGQRIQRRPASVAGPEATAIAQATQQRQLPDTYFDVPRGPSAPRGEPKDPLQAVGEETILAIQQGVSRLISRVVMATDQQPLAKGYQTPDGRRQSIAEACQQLSGSGTRFHPSDNPTLDRWRMPPTSPAGAASSSSHDTIDIHFRLQSTLSAAREWAWSARAPYERIGVLNCAHPTIPGGGFNTAAGAFKSQEASLNRASNLSYALFSPTAAPFYSFHKTNQGINNGFYSNTMVYARDVTLIRDDLHEWAFPLKVDVVNATPVDAIEVKRKLVKQGGMSKETMRKLVTEGLEERMGRILRLFELEGDNVLILTGFGAGACGNPMSTIARIWAKLLGPGGRFYGKFANVIFAIPSDMAFHEFSSSFNAAIARSAASDGQIPEST